MLFLPICGSPPPGAPLPRPAPRKAQLCLLICSWARHEALGVGQVAGCGLAGMWVGSPERPRLTASGSSSTAGLWSLRLQLAPGWAVCVCVCKLSPEAGHRALGTGSPWPGSLLTPANKAWAFLVPPTHPPPFHLVLAEKWPCPPAAADSGPRHLEEQLKGRGVANGQAWCGLGACRACGLGPVQPGCAAHGQNSRAPGLSRPAGSQAPRCRWWVVVSSNPVQEPCSRTAQAQIWFLLLISCLALAAQSWAPCPR